MAIKIFKATLKKREARGKFRMNELNSRFQRTSAKWEIKELPGLILAQIKNTSIASDKTWCFANVHLPYDECLDVEVLLEELEPRFHTGVIAWHQLQGQQFHTRQEALQALQVIKEYRA